MQGIIAQIVPARPALLRRKGGRPYPPTLFVHMAERDPEWAAQIEEALRYCRWVGVELGAVEFEQRMHSAGPESAGPAGAGHGLLCCCWDCIALGAALP